MSPQDDPPDSLLQVDCEPAAKSFEVSVASKTKNGTLKLIFTKPSGQNEISCRKLTVTLPFGAGADDFAVRADPIRGNTGGTLSLSAAKRATDTDVIFTCTKSGPVNYVTFTTQSTFVLTITPIPVSRIPGQSTVTITEETTETPTIADSWTERSITVSVEKSIEDFFFFRSFSSKQPQVDNSTNDKKAILHWEGSETDVTYHLTWSGDAGGTQPRVVRDLSCETHDLTDTTTFVLDAQTADPNGGTEPIHHYLSTTVTVKNPDINARTLTATDRVTVDDTFTARKTGGTPQVEVFAPTTFEGNVDIMANHTLKVGGSITGASVSAGTGTVTGGTVTASGTVSGASVTAGTGTVSGGTVTATGAVTGASVSAGTGAVTGGTVTATGTVSGASLSAGTGAVTGGTVTATGAVSGGSVSAGTGTVSGGTVNASTVIATSNITAGGQRVIRVRDILQLEVNSHNKELYLYCETGSKDNVYGGKRYNDQGVTLSNTLWTVHQWGVKSSAESSDDPNEPDATEAESA